MVSHANNHAFDYGSEGVLETIEHGERAGIALSGSGKDLQAARHAAVCSVADKRVAHLSMAEAFIPYGRASRSRPDMRGRPGVNPLALEGESSIGITSGVAAFMKRIDGLLGRDTERYGLGTFRRFGKRFVVGERMNLRRGRRLAEADRQGNLDAIESAAASADLTVVSLHSHFDRGWRSDFLRDAVAAGADVVLIHGAHEVGGIEIVDGRPVFHSLGDFAFQIEQVAVFPSDAYDQVGLDDTAGPADLVRHRDRRSLVDTRTTFEGCAARIRYDAAMRPTISLLPLDLQFDAKVPHRGRPQLAAPQLGEAIIREIAQKSRKFGTRIDYDPVTNTGVVDCYA